MSTTYTSPPCKGANLTFRCGHPRSPDNTRYNRNRGKLRARCDTCLRAQGRAYHEATYQPVLCAGCDQLLGPGRPTGRHPDCEPWVCECDNPDPSPVSDRVYGRGECKTCRRPVLTDMWHERWNTRSGV